MLSTYIVTALILASVSVIWFVISFRKNRKGSRKIVLVSVMTALALVSRFIPVLKPLTALVIITGLWLGPEAGFLSGALAMFISDIWFGQGPWTPFQMAAAGITGMFAGILSPFLKKNKVILIVYSIICGIAYSFIMDIWTVLSYGTGFSLNLYLAALVSAVPYTISYCASNAVWLWIFEKPFGEKFSRIIKKYGV